MRATDRLIRRMQMQLVAVTYSYSILNISFACQRNSRRNPQKSSRWLRLPDHKFCRLLLPSSTSTREADALPCHACIYSLMHMAGQQLHQWRQAMEKKNVCVLGFYTNRRNQLACTLPGYLFSADAALAAMLWCLVLPRSDFVFLS